MHRLETIYYSELSRQLNKFDFNFLRHKYLLKLFPLYSLYSYIPFMYSVWTHYKKCLQRQENLIVKYGFFILGKWNLLNCRKEIYWITTRKLDYFNASSFRNRKNLEKRLRFFHVLLAYSYDNFQRFLTRQMW